MFVFLEHDDVVLYLLIFIVDFTNKNHGRIYHKCEKNEHHDKMPRGFVRLLIAFIFIILHFLAQEAKKW